MGRQRKPNLLRRRKGKIEDMKFKAPVVARFEKVPFEQFEQDFMKFCKDNPEFVWKDGPSIQEMYDGIRLPERSTSRSSGYDFFMPFRLEWVAWKTYNVPMGVRAEIQDGWFLLLMPKSGLGMRFVTRLTNTVGNVDADYYGAKNYGHIIASVRMEATSLKWDDSGKSYIAPPPRSREAQVFERGQKVYQGVFLTHGIAEGDEADTVRTGGFGSTGA